MSSSDVISDDRIKHVIELSHFTHRAVDECRLELVELLVKAGAGYYNSHTEEQFLSKFSLVKKDRTPNKRGREFLMRMMYASSNNKPECYVLMTKYRK